MTTIYLKGGLGNQMFQYAYGRSKSFYSGEELVLDLSDLLFPAELRKRDTPRIFKLDHFDIKARIYRPLQKPLLRQLVRKIHDKLFKTDRYYQSESYFKDVGEIIRKDFTLLKQFSEKAHFTHRQIASSTNPVSLHIRRGDYVSHPNASIHHGVLPIEYYKEAVLRIEKSIPNPIFFVFSDDIEWAKSNLIMPYQFIFVSDSSIPDYEEIILMSKCHHHIIANSSFSWWGAWLNPLKEKTVIAPKQWFASSNMKDSICPPEWLRI